MAKKQKKKNKINIYIYIIGIVAILLIVFFIILFKNNESKNLDVLTGFEYYSGSSGYSIRMNGTRNEETINIDFNEFYSGEQTLNNFTITFNDFKELLNITKEENCKKHTYDYQCGESDGCSYSSFEITFENSDDSACYQIDYRISNFFNNLAEVYNEINYSNLSKEEQIDINLIELLEDIKSIKESDKLIEIENANHTESYDDAMVYEGKGYTIKLFFSGEKTKCVVSSNNNNEIWTIEK